MTEQIHRRHRPESRWKQIWRRFRFEIVVGIVIVLGVFLLLERMNIRTTLIRWLQTAIAGAVYGSGRIDDVAQDALEYLTLSNTIGIVLILGALLAIALRIRWQLMHSPALTKMTCPACGGELFQVHRRPPERLIDWYIPFRRYRCRNHDCRWQGLKVKASKTSSGRFSRVGKGEIAVFVLLVILVAIFVGSRIGARAGGSSGPEAWLELNGIVSGWLA